MTVASGVAADFSSRLAVSLGIDRARIEVQRLLRFGEILGILGHRHEGILQDLGAVGRQIPGGATKGNAMKNGCSANSSSARILRVLDSSRPVGTSDSSGSLVNAQIARAGARDRSRQSAGWPAINELRPTTWPSSSPLCMARNIGAAPECRARS